MVIKVRDMARRKLYKDSDYIQIVVSKEDKVAFDAWCAANSTTMSEVMRQAIAPYVAKGRELEQMSA